jgi:protein SCO1/2
LIKVSPKRTFALMNKRVLLLLLVIPVAFISWYLVSKNKKEPIRLLPYFGPKHAVKKDSSYHTVPPFQFVDQNNETVSEKTFLDKVYVTEYFFTTCQSICPVMNNHLMLVDSAFRSRNDVMILSHTVDPENDSVPVLRDYAITHGADHKKWRFVTGNKKELYDMARKGYLLNAEEGNGGAEDFIHTQNFTLVDKDRHIRGFYDGTDSAEVSRLIREIKILLNEYDYKAAAN